MKIDQKTLDKLFAFFAFFCKHIVYLRSGNYKQNFSGDKSILAFGLKKHYHLQFSEDYLQIDQIIKSHTQNNEIVFCVSKYEASQITQKQQNNKTFLNKDDGELFDQQNQITLIVFTHVISCSHLSSKISKTTILVNILTQILKLIPYSFFTLFYFKKTSKTNSNLSDEEYLLKTSKIIEKINNGDFLQTNFTRKFFGFCKHICTSGLFLKLCSRSNVFYSSFIKLGGCYVLCLSPERFLQKTGNIIQTNPIKGSTNNILNANKELLNAKNTAENIMIADLMRNDFYKICKQDSLKNNIFNIDKYKNIAHLSSSIKGILKNGVDINDILTATLPIGSMTGAPKQMAVDIAAQFEEYQRGIYSGFIGYFDKDNFDLSVAIRCLLLSKNKYELQAGGAITTLSNPKDELNELNAKIGFIFDEL